MASIWVSVELAGVSGYGDPDSNVRMPKSRYDFSVSMNPAGFGLKKCALTFPVLPVRWEWPFLEKLAIAEGVTGVEGVTGMKGGAERFAGVRGFDCAEDWGYYI